MFTIYSIVRINHSKNFIDQVYGETIELLINKKLIIQEEFW